MASKFSVINKHLKSISGNTQGLALKRIDQLTAFICGMINTGRSSLQAVGSGMQQDTDSHSKTTAIKRFLSNKKVCYRVHFLPFLMNFLKGFLSKESVKESGVTLVIDGSQIGKDHGALMISLFWKNRGIPIFWLTKKGGKGHFKTQDHQDLVKEAIEIIGEIFPDSKPITILGDGEFDSIDLQKLCLKAGWNYVFRTAVNTSLYEENEKFKAKYLSVGSGQDFIFIPNVDFTEKRFKSVNFVYWHEIKKYKEAIPLISNMQCPFQIIDAYKLRYSIECLFKDLKSNMFNLHKTRLKKPKEISNLILIAALAFILLMMLSIHCDTPKYRKKVQRVRKDQKVLSFAAFAMRLIEYFRNIELGLPLGFDFLKGFSAA